MQALVTTSRSISQDKFVERDKKLKYDRHIKKIDDILKQKTHPIISFAKETQKMTLTRYRHKESSKTFRQSQEKAQIKKENRRVLEKIWKIDSQIRFDTHEHLQHVSGSNWHYKKRQADAIKQENKRFVRSILSKKGEVEDYKKKMNQEIKQYMELKNQIRKFKFDPPKKKTLPRSKSQRKAVDLILHKPTREEKFIEETIQK